MTAITTRITVTVRVITGGGALLPLAGSRAGTGGRAALPWTEQLLTEGEDGDEAGDLVHLHPVVPVLSSECRVENLHKNDFISYAHKIE